MLVTAEVPEAMTAPPDVEGVQILLLMGDSIRQMVLDVILGRKMPKKRLEQTRRAPSTKLTKTTAKL